MGVGGSNPLVPTNFSNSIGSSWNVLCRPVASPRAGTVGLNGRSKAAGGAQPRLTQRKPMWLVLVSIISGCRAAGR